ncbi:MAG: zinc ABC transporter substrate-binding protein, partial [Pelagibacteraceae bacterium]|nr:zinc ABC transporter substrate-binding protein [Pelagibacteraceae bacterium]
DGHDDEHDEHDEHDGHDDEHDGHDDEHDEHDEHDGHDDEHDGHDDEHDGHNHGEYDAHLWLDPSNAIEMVLEISHELSELDPENKDKYKANANKTIVGLDKLINDVNKSLSKDVKYKYIVFHDAYQYFEKRFDITSAGALTLNPDVLPGAQQIKDIQKLIKEKNIKCIFSEPQYNPKIIETLANDTNITTGIMDPLGAYLDKGIPMYNELIMNISDSVKQC